MALTLLAFQSLLVNEDRGYRARACGRERDDGTWEGWIEFVPEDGGRVLASARETTQPNLTDLEYWATGLTPVYLEGALERALTRTSRSAPGPPDPPAYDGPAQPGVQAEPFTTLSAILDPFSVYANGEDLLRGQLGALSPRHLRTIIRTYDLVGEPNANLEVLDETEMIALIVTAARARFAA